MATGRRGAPWPFRQGNHQWPGRVLDAWLAAGPVTVNLLASFTSVWFSDTLGGLSHQLTGRHLKRLGQNADHGERRRSQAALQQRRERAVEPAAKCQFFLRQTLLGPKPPEDLTKRQCVLPTLSATTDVHVTISPGSPPVVPARTCRRSTCALRTSHTQRCKANAASASESAS